jgi:5-methylcytosine-specific restriction endonuclease McrA
MAVDALLFYMRAHLCTTHDEAGKLVAFIPCPECGHPLLAGQAIQFDHHHADGMGGPHEYQNLRPIHYDPCHKKKTARDVGAQAKVRRITGQNKPRPKTKIANRPFQKTHRPFRRSPKP